MRFNSWWAIWRPTQLPARSFRRGKSNNMNRRNFTNTLALGASALALPRLPAAPVRKLRIGHTCITWGSFVRPGAEATIEPALKDISAEGFWSFETFPELLETLDQKDQL